ncbi:uncharacterized protein [Argopecten irradians]|uniref:uncharacterized protein n=1 Tax=Argopecten irradians TaxID=31199 RepID=UPI00371CE69A
MSVAQFNDYGAPSDLKLDLNGHQVVGSVINNYYKHNCTGDVGYPPGEVKVQYAAVGSSVFNELSVSNIQTSPSEWLCNSTERTIEFVIDFNPNMDGGVIRCVVTSADMNVTTYSNNATIELIPGNICTTTDANVKIIHHPTNCKKYVTCYEDPPVPKGYDDCNGLCVKIENGLSASCVDCSQDVCPNTGSTTTATSTTLGPSYLTCGEISGYISDAVSLQCQITSADFDEVVVSHSSSTSPGKVLLGSVTKTTSIVTTTDAVWTGLNLIYYTISTIDFINITIPAIACDMSGAFYLNLTTGALWSEETSNLNVLATPSTSPTISQKAYLEGTAGQIECIGDVGNPIVEMVLQYHDATSGSDVELTSEHSGDDVKEGCTFKRTIRSTASLSTLNGTAVKCVTSYSNGGSAPPTTLESNPLTILLIPDNTCESTNASLILHPYDCHRYVQCGDSTITEFVCPGSTCFNPIGNNCDIDCSRCP